MASIPEDANVVGSLEVTNLEDTPQKEQIEAIKEEVQEVKDEDKENQGSENQPEKKEEEIKAEDASASVASKDSEKVEEKKEEVAAVSEVIEEKAVEEAKPVEETKEEDDGKEKVVEKEDEVIPDEHVPEEKKEEGDPGDKAAEEEDEEEEKKESAEMAQRREEIRNEKLEMSRTEFIERENERESVIKPFVTQAGNSGNNFFPKPAVRYSADDPYSSLRVTSQEVTPFEVSPSKFSAKGSPKKAKGSPIKYGSGHRINDIDFFDKLNIKRKRWSPVDCHESDLPIADSLRSTNNGIVGDMNQSKDIIKFFRRLDFEKRGPNVIAKGAPTNMIRPKFPHDVFRVITIIDIILREFPRYADVSNAGILREVVERVMNSEIRIRGLDFNAEDQEVVKHIFEDVAKGSSVSRLSEKSFSGSILSDKTFMRTMYSTMTRSYRYKANQENLNYKSLRQMKKNSKDEPGHHIDDSAEVTVDPYDYYSVQNLSEAVVELANNSKPTKEFGALQIPCSDSLAKRIPYTNSTDEPKDMLVYTDTPYLIKFKTPRFEVKANSKTMLRIIFEGTMTPIKTKARVFIVNLGTDKVEEHLVFNLEVVETFVKQIR